MRFLAIGECMAELAPLGTPGDYHLGFAGDTFNTAWYLARIAPKVAVSYFTAVGTDKISQQMRAMFRASGIDDRSVREVADRTVGLYLISLENGERSFSYWRRQAAARVLAQDPAALDSAIVTADVIYFSGITLAILEPEARQVLLAALHKARALGKTVGFDPNLRPRLWANSAEMTEAIMQGAAVSSLVLPSFEDEAEWFNDRDPQATGARYAGAGAQTVVVKNGAAPVYYLQGDQTGVVAVPPLTEVVDTTAAGDSFNAGFLAGLAQHKSLPDSIALACRLARSVVQGRGALVPVEPADFTSQTQDQTSANSPLC